MKKTSPMLLSDVCDFIDSPEGFKLLYKEHEVVYLNQAGAISDCSRFYVAGHEFGPTHLIHVEAYHGDGYQSAWEEWIDESPTIEEDELVEAYGLDGESFIDQAHAKARGDNPPYGTPGWDEAMKKIRGHAKLLLKQAGDRAQEGLGEYPDLIEGYEHQSNSSGTGVVSVGHYAWMNEADLEDVEIVRKEPEVEQKAG